MASPLERPHIQQVHGSTSSSSLYSTLLFLLLLFFASLTLISFQNSTTQSRNFRKLIPAAGGGLTTKMAVDPYAFLHITRNPDGSITRLRHEPTAAANNGTDPFAAVWSRDIPLNSEKQTWIRLFLPRINATTNTSAALNKLPIVVYLHGGGFVFLSADDARFHGFCERMAADLGVLVASVNYRLAPEHRLPAAYEDADEALDLIIRKSSDPWLVEHGDRSRCVLMGESAGGNIAYQAALQKAGAEIKGVVLVQPYFGGVQRTASEERSVDDAVLPLSANDLMWELSLPVGSDRDHEYCNPTIGGGSDLVVKWRDLGLRVVLTACDGDPLFDREMELAKLLEERGVGLQSKVWAGYYHGVFLTDRVLGKELFGIMRNNVLSSTS